MKYPMRLVVLLIVGVTAPAWSDCPPWFYQKLPRDRDFHYAAGKAEDVTGARLVAANRLADSIPPHAIAGWEQDDHMRCGDNDYVLIRIEKRKVSKAINDEQMSKREVADRLAGRLATVEGGQVELNAANAQQANELRVQSDRVESVAKRFAHLEQSRSSASDGPADGYVPPKVYAMQSRKLNPLIAKSFANIDSGQYRTKDIAMIIVSFNTMQRHGELHRFCKRIMAPEFDLDREPGLRGWATERCLGR